MATKISRNSHIITSAEDYFIDLLSEGLMKLDRGLYRELAGMSFRELQTVYRCVDDERLDLLTEVGVSLKDAIIKLIGGTKWHCTLTDKINAMSDEDADELAERIKTLAEVKFILEDEFRNLP